MAINFSVNGRPVSVNAPESTRLLWVLREELKLTGTKFGCGADQCGRAPRLDRHRTKVLPSCYFPKDISWPLPRR